MRSGARVRGIPLLASSFVVSALTLFLLTMAFGDFAFGSANGPDDGYAGNPPLGLDCTICHFDSPPNTGAGNLEILNLPTTFVPGSTYTLMVALSDPGQMRWGFELTVLNVGDEQAGELVVTDPVVTKLSDNADPEPDYLKHTFDGAYFAPDVSPGWTFDWVAPNLPTVTFYVAGNAANASEEPSGDRIYTRSYTIMQGTNATEPGSWGKIKSIYATR